jgi:hypothetical protein
LSRLVVQGNLEHPVRFLGDRLDPFYRDLPGQWDGIYLEQGSQNNEINYAVIKNANFGISVDSSYNIAIPTLKLDNTIIQNMIYEDLYAYATNVQSTNCVFGDCGRQALAIEFGGSYDFRQLTIGNYWSSSVRLDSALYISNFIYGDLGRKITNPLINAYFGNIILYGSNADELSLAKDPSADFNFLFENCLLHTNKNTSDPTHFSACLINKDPGFVNTETSDYRIDSISPAIKQGKELGILFDILGKVRGNPPDIGAYQYVPGK